MHQPQICFKVSFDCWSEINIIQASEISSSWLLLRICQFNICRTKFICQLEYWMDRTNKFLSVDRFVNIKIKKNVTRIVFVVDVKATSTTKTIQVTLLYTYTGNDLTRSPWIKVTVLVGLSLSTSSALTYSARTSDIFSWHRSNAWCMAPEIQWIQYVWENSW